MPGPMLTLRGAPALSDHQTQKLFERVRAVAKGVRGVYAEYVHFVDVSAPLDDGERALLDRLLVYGPSVPRRKLDGVQLLVVPRLGTRSPSCRAYAPTTRSHGPQGSCSAASSSSPGAWRYRNDGSSGRAATSPRAISCGMSTSSIAGRSTGLAATAQCVVPRSIPTT